MNVLLNRLTSLFLKLELFSIPHSFLILPPLSFNTKLLERVVYFHSSFPYLLFTQASALNHAFETVLSKIINDLTLQKPTCNFRISFFGLLTTMDSADESRLRSTLSHTTPTFSPVSLVTPSPSPTSLLPAGVLQDLGFGSLHFLHTLPGQLPCFLTTCWWWLASIYL